MKRFDKQKKKNNIMKRSHWAKIQKKKKNLLPNKLTMFIGEHFVRLLKFSKLEKEKKKKIL